MKYRLRKPINYGYSTLEQILTNRGINIDDVEHYCNTTDNDINSPLLLGEDKLRGAAVALLECIKNNQRAALITDADCDGYTAAALLINYLYNIVPNWIENNLDWYLHSGKQHGLSDFCDQLLEKKYKLVIVPDAGSGDIKEHQKLREAGVTTIVLDHHPTDLTPADAIIINNQLSDYPNKNLSGVGVTWQFCRYLDSLLGKNYANNYLDLVALGLVGDMMDLTSLETKHLVQKGFLPENIHNPFIYEMWQKNFFKLGEKITPIGAAFYIAPFVNAMVRSGEPAEKELLFNSMLNHKAYTQVISTKRGHRLGQMESLVEQAVRTCTNVKNRQTKAVDEGMNLLEGLIEERHLLDNKVLLFLLEPGQIDPNIAGLVANKEMAKHQKPCCVLTKVEQKENFKWKNDDKILLQIDIVKSYQGSARGCDLIGINNFKDICEHTGVVDYAKGHQSAFGLGLAEEAVPAFIEATNEALKDMPDETYYYVDYIYYGNQEVNGFQILEIADLEPYWGQNMEEPLIAIEGLQINSNMIRLMSADAHPTLKIALSNGVSLIKFNSSEEEYASLCIGSSIKLNIVGKCNKNCWNNKVSPQIFIEDYDIVQISKYAF